MKPLTWSGTPQTNVKYFSIFHYWGKRLRPHKTGQAGFGYNHVNLYHSAHTSHNLNKLLPQEMVCLQLAGWQSQSSSCSPLWDLYPTGKTETLEKATENFKEKWRKINRRLLPPIAFYIYFIPNNSVAEVNFGVTTCLNETVWRIIFQANSILLTKH